MKKRGKKGSRVGRVKRGENRKTLYPVAERRSRIPERFLAHSNLRAEEQNFNSYKVVILDRLKKRPLTVREGLFI
jgi:hypothetical protein